MKYLKVLISVSVLAVLAIASCGDTVTDPVIAIKTGPTGTITDATEAVFTWTVNDPSESIASYAIQKDNGNWVALAAPATTYTWENLTEGARKLSIKVLNSENSELAVITWSFTYTPQTVDEDRAPGKPTGITAAQGDQRVTVSWTAPTDTGITGGNGTTGVIDKYTVYWGTSAGVTIANKIGSEDTQNGTTLSLIIDNLINDTPYFFIVTATNTTGESAISAEESATPSAGAVANSPPDAPTGVTSNAGDGNVAVSWTAPVNKGTIDNNGTPGVITKYTVYWGATGVNTNSTQKADVNSGTTYTINTGVSNGTAVYFIVTAWNAAGESAATAEESATPSATKIDVASVEINDGATTASVVMNGSLALTAKVLPADASVKGVTWESGDTAIATVDASGVVTPVKASSTAVTITATSTDDTSISDTIDVTVKEANRAPGAPSITTVTPEAQQVTVEWTAPNDLGIVGGDGSTGTITGYTVYWETSANVTTGSGNSKDAGSGATSLVIDNLTKGTAYYFIVTATNTTAESVASGEQGTVTLTTVPGAPTNVQVSAGDAEVTVSWGEPTDTGGATITGYTVYWKASTGVTTADNDGNAVVTGSSHTITGLANGTEVFVVVTATNAGGEGAASGEVSAIPFEANRAPGAPTAITATAGDGVVTVGWTAPNDTGIINGNGTAGTITKYTVYWGTAANVTTGSLTKKDTLDGMARSLVIDSLINTTTYYFIVTASNDTGESGISDEESATPKAPESLNDYSLSYPVAKRNGSNISVSPIWKKGAADEAPAAGGVSYDIAPALPASLTLNSASGTISGTVSAMLDLANVTAYQITATGNGSDYIDTAAGTFLDKFVSGEYTQDTTGTAISDIDGLKAMALDGEYYLTAHIDLSTEQSWAPIATSASPFTGKLHGNGYAIYNLTIDDSANTHQGLFASVSGADVAIDNLSIGVTNIKGQAAVGALAGVATTGATLSNIGVAPMTADPDSTKIETVGIINLGGTNGGHTGGVVGHIDGATSLTGYSLVNVVGSEDLSGGLAGSVMENGTVSGYSAGTVGGKFSTGGLVGFNNGTVSGYSTGAVTGAMNSVGGLVGFNQGNVAFVSGYATGAINGVDILGGILGNNKGKTAIGYATGTVAAATNSGGLVGSSLDTTTNTGYWDKTSTGKDNRGGDASAGGTAVGITATKDIVFATGDYADGGNSNLVIFDDNDFTAIFDTANGASKTWPKLKSSYTFNGNDYNFDFPQPTVTVSASDADTIEVTY